MRTFARAHSASVAGAEARLVDIQVSVVDDEHADGNPFFRIVGLPDSALREGRERIKGAIAHGEWRWPGRGVTVNLAPASARKEGAALDLPIALAVLAAGGSLGPPGALAGWICLGELGLDGTVRGVRGVLASIEAARACGILRALVPRANAAEAAAVSDVRVHAVAHLADAVEHLTGERRIEPEVPRPWTPDAWDGRAVLEVRGQENALRAALVAAVGAHNLLLCGPPGAGKTLLARHVADLLLPLTRDEALEVSRVHSVAGLLDRGLVSRRPFRAPHHTTSLAGLVGGGSILRPGEISLAHLGVLFLDELAEFPRPHLEALRQPLEDGVLVLGRASGRAVFPCDLVLVAATNPCPCGWAGVEGRCRCSPHEVRRYSGRVSGPLRDRFDLQVDVRPVDPGALVSPADRPPIDRGVVFGARERQNRRAARLGLVGPAAARFANARIPGRLLPDAVEPTPAAREALVTSARRLGLSGRGIHRALRVARTLADLEGSDRVEVPHVRRALAWRPGPSGLTSAEGEPEPEGSREPVPS